MAPALRDALRPLARRRPGVLSRASLAGSVVTLVPWGMRGRPVRRTNRARRPGSAHAAGRCCAASRSRRFWPLLGWLLRRWDDRRERAVGERPRGDGVVRAARSGASRSAFGRRRSRSAASSSALGLPPLVREDGVRRGFAALGIACLARRVVAGLVLREGPRRRAAPARRRGPTPFRDRARLVDGASEARCRVAPQMCLVGFTVRLLARAAAACRRARPPQCSRACRCSGSRARIAAGRWSDVVASRIAPLRTIALVTAGSTLLTAAPLGAPLVVLVPVLVAAGSSR